MMLPQAIEDTDERVDELLSALDTRLSGRLVRRGFRHYSEADSADLATGMLRIVTTGEGNYAAGRHMVAKEGTTRVSLIGHLMISETGDLDADSETLEKAELAFIEEIKTAMREGHAALDLAIDSWEKSRLQELPYGWFVVQATLGPPRAGTH